MNTKLIINKFILMISIMVLMLSTFIGYKAFAYETTEEMGAKGTGFSTNKVGDSGTLTLTDLITNYSLFCCSKGTMLPENSSSPSPMEQIVEWPDLDNPYPKSKYMSNTLANYTITEINYAKPKEAYILSEMINNIVNDNIEYKPSSKEFTDINQLEDLPKMIIGDKEIYIKNKDKVGNEIFIIKANNGKYYYVEPGDEGYWKYSYVQVAWWSTELGGGNTSDADQNALFAEATAFENYIKKIAINHEIDDKSTYVDYNIDIPDYKGTLKAPNIKYEAYFMTGKENGQDGQEYNLNNPVVNWDVSKQKYVIGPFAVYYTEAGYASERRNPVQFAGITDAKLYTDANPNEPLERGKDWNFLWVEREKNDVTEFPAPEEIFYIELNYKDNATQITDMVFDFFYMNAAAKYEKLQGTFSMTIYQVSKETLETCDPSEAKHPCIHGYTTSHQYVVRVCKNGTTDSPCEHGNTSEHNVTSTCTSGYVGAPCEHNERLEHPIKIRYYLDSEGTGTVAGISGLRGVTDSLGASSSLFGMLKGQAPGPGGGEIGGGPGTSTVTAQDLIEVTDAARWKEKVSISRNIGLKFGKISINKDVINSEGEAINDDGSFEFEVTVNGAINSSTEIIVVKAGEISTTKEYYWMGDEVPTYTVKEVKIPSGYEAVSLTPSQGSLISNGTVAVKAVNKCETIEGTLQIEKKIDDSSGHGNSILGNKTFPMNVTISGTFTYDNVKYTQDGEPLRLTVNVPANGMWKLDKPIKWNKNADNPTYIVEEVENPNEYVLVDAQNTTGIIIPSKEGIATATITNGPVKHKAKLQMIKTLENADKLSREEIEALTYSFKIEVANYPEINVTIKAQRDGNGYRWYWVSEYFYWYTDELEAGRSGPKYTVTEVGLNEGTQLISATVNGRPVSINNNSYTTYLQEDFEHDYYFKNELLNKIITSKNGSLSLTKVIEDNDYLKNKNYNFFVFLYGTKFYYNGVECTENDVLQLGTDGSVSKLDKSKFDLGIYDEEKYVTINIANDTRNTWNSLNIEWFGEKSPTYEVMENTQGEKFTHTIIPSIGEINKTQKTEVIAYNNMEEDYGYIFIYKKLKEANYIDEKAIKNQVFKFRIEVEGFNTIEVSITPEKINNEWVWYYLSDPYFWKRENSAPKYKVTEIIVSSDYEIDPSSSIVKEGTLQKATNILTKNELKQKIIDGLVEEDYFFKVKLDFLNRTKSKQGNLQIIKEVDSASIANTEFLFDVTIKGKFYFADDPNKVLESYTFKDIKVTSNNPGSLNKTVCWKGYNNAPTYEVTEHDSNDAKLQSIINRTGKLTDGSVAKVTAINKVNKTGGYLTVKKVVQKGANDKDIFYFNVKIGNNETTIGLKAGESWTSNYFEWDVTQDAPSYEVTETNSGKAELVSLENSKGKLMANSIVEAIATNAYKEEHSGEFSIKKEVIAEKKIVELTGVKFDISFKVSSSTEFEVDGKTYGAGNGDYTGKIQLADEEVYNSSKITWYGDIAPQVYVSENLDDKTQDGWKLIGISNNNATLRADSNLSIVVSNLLPVNTIIDLTMELGGYVWEDILHENDKNMDALGTLDSDEVGIDGVEVYIYSVLKNGGEQLATIYEDLNKTELAQPIITSNGGKWSVPRIMVPSDEAGIKAYNVVFVYDGQTYEATKFLNDKEGMINGNANTFINFGNNARTPYFNLSMAKDINRDEVNSRIEKIYGLSAMDSNLTTIGQVSGPNGVNSVKYIGEINKENYTHLRSTLQTVDPETGIAYELFKAKASTGIAGLTYPFNVEDYTGVALTNYDTYYSPLGYTERYQYHALYNYALHINLGLVKRTPADIEVSKDLVSAKVVLNGSLSEIRCNKLAQLNDNVQTRKMKAESESISYQVGLYKTDYYYRAEMYRNESDVYDKMLNYYDRQLGIAFENLDLKVYLNYKITVQNSSQEYTVKINSLTDYYDSSFRLVTNTEDAIIKENGKNVKKAIVTKNVDFDDLQWQQSGNTIIGSDGITYNKMTVNLNDEIKSGERIDYKVTFEIDKDVYKGSHDAIMLGQKGNLAEVSNYSTYYKNGKLAGKIDVDSAPDNLNVRDFAEKQWFEDDTDRAPILNIEIENDEKLVKGMAWEDRAENGALGDGIYSGDDNEARIKGLTTQLVEKINVDGILYDYVWPTNEPIPSLGGRTIESATGFDSTIETNEIGEYEFKAVPNGNYVVRALYGNNKEDLIDTANITGDSVAVKKDGSKFVSDDGILTTNYDNDKVGYTPAVYNGHDYKATLYKGNVERGNDFRDNEIQRLLTTANSTTLTNTNVSILATANDVTVSHKELYDKYNMFADSDVIEIADRRDDNNKLISYTIENIDIGLIERPENNIVLDKQISSIKLITNDEKVILDAEYDVNYVEVDEQEAKNHTVIAKLQNNKYLVAKVTLNQEKSIATDLIQAINKTENKLSDARVTISGKQNFRFINIDDEILQGCTIVIDYVMTALNVSEEDYISKDIANLFKYNNEKQRYLTDKEIADAILGFAANSNNDGRYLGSYYYTGTKGSNDELVTTRIRQVVDYVDNDAVFIQEDNNKPNASWKTTTEVELAGNGIEHNRIVDLSVIPEFKLYDDKGVAYTADSHQNIILSIDNLDTDTANSSFERMLVPRTDANKDSDDYKAQLRLRISRTVASADVANNAIQYDFENLVEVVKYQNTSGRRDEITVPGNANPTFGTFVVGTKNFERDSSATEIITFIPPTGSDVANQMTMQVLLAIIATLGIAVIGIIIIKKKILK